MSETQTPTTPPTAVVRERLQSVEDTLDWLATLDLSAVPGEDTEDLVETGERIARKTHANIQIPLTQQVIDRGIAAEHGCRSTVSYLQNKLHLTRSEANARVTAAERFQPTTQLSGETVPARYPEVAAAMSSGEISAAHARTIADSLGRLPAAVSVDDRDKAEAHLVEVARDWDPTSVGKLATHLEAVLDPNGQLITEAEQVARRELTMTKSTHGMWRVQGWFDAEAANIVQAALGALSKPRPGPDGERDPRSGKRRFADAFVKTCELAMADPDMPTHGGMAPQVVATVTLAELEQRAGVGWLTNGDPISITRVLEMLCAADTALAVFDHHGEVLHYGRTRRLATPGQRKALEARDRGCSFDGCDAPALWTEAHHVYPWSHGGKTDVCCLALLCKYHHTLIHQGDWRLVMINGVPHTIAPKWIDAKQRPRRNRAHGPP